MEFTQMARGIVVSLIALTAGLLTNTSTAQHRLVTQGNGKLAIVEANGKISWEMPWGGIHDIHVLDNGNLMVQQGQQKVVEIDRQTKQIVWTYDSQTQNAEGDSPVEVHAFQPLANGHVMIAESGRGRIIEVDREGKIHKQIRLKLNSPHPHMDTRLARQLDDGSYLVCHEGDGFVRHYDDAGKVIWEFEIPLHGRDRRDGHGTEAFGNKVFGAVRLQNGNYLIATGNGHSVLEVNPKTEIVWRLDQNDLPGITLAWVTTLEVLPNGHYVIGNCHAGPQNPILIEIDPATKQVVWQFDQYETFGNNVSNSQLLDMKQTLR
jgi:outer membrane protein assembly factor BamB